MKVKSLKNHYYEGVIRYKGQEYFCDDVFGERVVRMGICKKLTTQRKKRVNKNKL